MVGILQTIYLTTVAVAIVYTVRHYLFTLYRLFINRPATRLSDQQESVPSVTVVIPAHNEQDVIERVLVAVLNADYPTDRLTIVAIDDRSTDGTAAVIDGLAARSGGRLVPFHRSTGPSGKAAALKDAMPLVHGEILVQFDADYVPGPTLIRRLVEPFSDPSVGLVMGRVVPENVGPTLVSRLLDLERAGGYQVDQQARMSLGLLPQYGGTVGGIRRAALADVGGWDEGTLAEDTDLTFRCMLREWRVVYLNRAECYEQVPATWADRGRQVARWARGHNQCLARYALDTVRAPHLRFAAKVDAVLLLGVFATPPLGLLGLATAVTLVLIGEPILVIWAFPMLIPVAFTAIGNYAPVFEIAAAVYLDGPNRRSRLLPFIVLSTLTSIGAATTATMSGIVSSIWHGPSYWGHTPHTNIAHSIHSSLRPEFLSLARPWLVLGVGSLTILAWWAVGPGRVPTVLIVVTIGVLGMPLVPALMEWLLPTDARPLEIVNFGTPRRREQGVIVAETPLRRGMSASGMTSPQCNNITLQNINASCGGTSLSVTITEDAVGCSAHRADRVLEYRPQLLAMLVGLTVLLTAVVWLALPAVGEFWGVIYEIWSTRLLLDTGRLASHESVFLYRSVSVPYPDVSPPLPSTSYSAGVLSGCSAIAVALWVRGRVRRSCPGPMTVLAYIGLFIQGAAAAAFILRPGTPAFGLREHTVAGQLAGLQLLLVVPAVHALVYYLFPFAFWRKAALSCLTVAFIILAVPHLSLLHAYLITQLSELAVLPLYFIFGFPVVILGCVGLYGYAMSWKSQSGAHGRRIESV